MTPKEKAKEIVDKYLNVEIMFYDADTVGEYIDIMRTEEAKQCALIAVEEIIASKPNQVYKIYSTWIPASTYWQAVKEQIEQL